MAKNKVNGFDYPKKGQPNKYIDLSQGVYIIDRYTYYALEFLEGVERGSKKTMGQLLEVCPQRLCMSTVGNRTDLFPRDPYQVKIIHTYLFHDDKA